VSNQNEKAREIEETEFMQKLKSSKRKDERSEDAKMNLLKPSQCAADILSAE
jgi:hypothetical protein